MRRSDTFATMRARVCVCMCVRAHNASVSVIEWLEWRRWRRSVYCEATKKYAIHQHFINESDKCPRRIARGKEKQRRINKQSNNEEQKRVCVCRVCDILECVSVVWTEYSLFGRMSYDHFSLHCHSNGSPACALSYSIIVISIHSNQKAI